MNAAIGLIRLPQSLTNVLEAADAVVLERAGALLEERIRCVEARASPVRAADGLSPVALFFQGDPVGSRPHRRGRRVDAAR